MSDLGEPSLATHDTAAAQAETALEIVGAYSWRRDAASGRLDWDRDPHPLLGWSIDELDDWSAWLERVHPDDRDGVDQPWDGDVRDLETEFRFRRDDGTWRWLCLRARRAEETGSIIGVVTDETGRRGNRRRSQMLLAELQHRIKNMVAIIRSMAHRTRENSADLDDFSAHFEGRLAAFVRVHSALARTADGDVDLEEIVREELRENGSPDAEPWRVSGPRVSLRQKPAELLTLAIHELITNAVKFGALSSPNGEIEVSWTLSANGSELILDWIERNGPEVSPPRRRGFGREWIEEALPYQLGARSELKFDPTGVRCRLVLIPDGPGGP